MVLSATACMLIASMVLGGCNKKPEQEEETSALTVDVKVAKHKELVIAETYVGTASAQQEVTVYPTASGEVLQVNVKSGDAVTEGQQLFKLDDESARLSLKSAQAGLASQQAQVDQTLGGQTALNQQKEQQGIDSAERSADTYARSAKEAEQNIARGERAVENAAQDRDEAKDKYETAKSLLSDWEDLQDDVDAFDGKTLSAANAMTVGSYDGTNPTASDLDDVADIVSDARDAGLDPSSISESGVDSLKLALRSQNRAVDSAKDALQDYRRSEKKAEDAEANADAELDNAVANQELTDGQMLEEQRKALQAGLASTAVGVEQAQYALDQYTTKSPITGVVESVSIDPHDTVGPSTAAMIITNKDSMKIDFSVTETVRDNLSVGQKVKVIKDDKKYKGRITEVGEMLDSATGMFKIQAVVNGGDGLLNGTTVTVKVDSYRDDSGIVIPYDAVYYSNGEPYIYVVEDGKAVRRDVETGMFDEKHIVIASGLDAGEQVITSWSADLRDGAEVQVAGEESDSSDGDKSGEIKETEKEAGSQSDEEADDSDGNTEKAGD